MTRNRLTQEKIVEAAITLIEKTSIADFSMHSLTKSLNIKTSSLYNHFYNMDSIMIMIYSNILKMQMDIKMEAIKGKSKKVVISLPIPTVIYNMADTFFIGQLNNPNQVTAATLAMYIFMFLSVFTNLLGIGGASVISHFLGSNNKIKAKQTSSFCIGATVIVSLLYGIIIICLKNIILPILVLMPQQ